MERRWSQHVIQSRSTKNGRWHFPNAIRKYGAEAFSHDILEVCHFLEVANIAEDSWIEFYDTTNPEKGFNLAKGGFHVPHPIKNPWDRPEYREKQALRPSPIHTPEAKANRLSALLKPEVQKKISNSLRGKPLSKERKKHLARVNKGRKHTEETKQKISSLNLSGTPEMKARLSASISATRKKNSYSHFLGVTFHKRSSAWLAYLRINGKARHLGSFKDEESAARAYDVEARKCGLKILNFHDSV